ncbi:MAG: hypothetical protein ACJASR_001024 [Psychroserpens sp.]|jgi:hypothetical protein
MRSEEKIETKQWIKPQVKVYDRSVVLGKTNTGFGENETNSSKTGS